MARHWRLPRNAVPCAVVPLNLYRTVLQYPELPEPVMDKMLTLDANELDLILQHPQATQQTVRGHIGTPPHLELHSVPEAARTRGTKEEFAPAISKVEEECRRVEGEPYMSVVEPWLRGKGLDHSGHYNSSVQSLCWSHGSTAWLCLPHSG